jgi:uncharacterized YigZ family protein
VRVPTLSWGDATDKRYPVVVRDHYRTITTRVEARIKVQRSEFIAVAFAVTSEKEFFEALTAIQRSFFDATHHCWAFRLFQGGTDRGRSSDAGEPNGTAGKPILNAIQSHDLSDTAIVVIRYFGGTKLGTGGLARAYRDAAAAALEAAAVEDRFVYTRMSIEVPYAATSIAYRLIDPPNVCLRKEEFGDTPRLVVDVRSSRVDEFVRTLDAKRLAYRIESDT